MISRIEALNYRCLRYIRRDLLPFQVLVGPNASGKSSFLDVLAFMSDLVFEGLSEAVSRRAPDVRDLVWMRSGDRFEIAVDVLVPDDRRERLKQTSYTGARYELSVGLSEGTLAILAETFWLTRGPLAQAQAARRLDCSRAHRTARPQDGQDRRAQGRPPSISRPRVRERSASAFVAGL